MIKTMMVLLVTSLFSLQAYSATNFKCLGNHHGTSVVLEAQVPGLGFTALSKGSGSVFVDGRIVTSFQKGDMKVSMLRRTFKAYNDHGDAIEGKVTDLRGKKAVIRRLVVPAYGINLKNISVSCR